LKVSVVVPAKNEEKAIGTAIQGIRAVMGKDVEILVVDGASTDMTVENAKKADAEAIVIQQEGTGKGMAVLTAIKHATGDIIAFIDSDLTYDPEDIPKVLEPILNGDADVVLGSRLSGKAEKGAFALINLVGNHIYSFLASLRCGMWITDSLTGLRAYRREDLAKIKLTSSGFEVETELNIKCAKQGLRTVEVPISYRKRIGGTKLRAFRDGLRILRKIIWT
jgi:glycosyltransferase involved in cell wall biosynthesis